MWKSETACAGDKWNLLSPETIDVMLCLSYTSCCTFDNRCDGGQKHLECSEMGPLALKSSVLKMSCAEAGCPFMSLYQK